MFTNLLQLTGYLAIPNCALTLFHRLRSGFDENELTIVYGFMCFFCDLILVGIVNKFRRKSLIVWSGSGMVVCMVAVLSLQVLGTSSSLQVVEECLYRKASLVALFSYLALSHLGFNEMIWIIIPELFPTIVRGTAYSIIGFVFFVVTVITFFVFPILLAYFHFLIIGTVFAISATGVILITVFFIPETRNIAL